MSIFHHKHDFRNYLTHKMPILLLLNFLLLNSKYSHVGRWLSSKSLLPKYYFYAELSDRESSLQATPAFCRLNIKRTVSGSSGGSIHPGRTMSRLNILEINRRTVNFS